MSAISFSHSQGTLSFRQPAQDVRQAWRWCVTVYRNHSDLVSSVSIFTMNTAILAAKLFRQIPKEVGHTAFFALNFTGLIWLNMQIRDLKKTGDDLHASVRENDCEGMVFTAAKVSAKALNILLTCSMQAAAFVTLCGLPHIALSMYGVMRPFSVFSLIVGIGSDIYDYEKNATLLNRAKTIEAGPQQEKVARAFVERLFRGRCAAGGEAKTLSLHIFRQLEHYTLEMFKKEIREKYPHTARREMAEQADPEQLAKIYAGIKKALKDKQTYTQSNLWLIALGYVSMGVCRVWPDTLLQSSVTWGMSLLYTSRLIYQKYLQDQLRRMIR